MYNDKHDDEVDTKRREFLSTAATALGGAGVALAAVPFVASLQPSAEARAAGAPIEIDIGALQPGEIKRAIWRGVPVWVVRRDAGALASLKGHEDTLVDPASEDSEQPPYALNEHRSIKPEYLVLTGVCTHLGCSPTYVPAGSSDVLGAEWLGGFYCPCHGSRFDLAGRVEKGFPAPSNLSVPPHRYIDAARILVGEDQRPA
ncbi:MAG: ubiquinol-cytochrome c reductase iron-sulfur subunit [Gammaproteobacteria bacterium]